MLVELMVGGDGKAAEDISRAGSDGQNKGLRTSPYGNEKGVVVPAKANSLPSHKRTGFAFN